MTIHSKGTCDDCKSASIKGPSKNNLEQIGNPVLIVTHIGRGKDRTDHSFFQCKKCGSVWVELEDSGAGGHGRYWQKLTKGLF